LRSVKRPSTRRDPVPWHGCCCCCGGGDRTKTVSKPQRTASQNCPSREIARAGLSPCRCASSKSPRSNSLPAQRAVANDLTISVSASCDHLTADAPPAPEDGAAVNLSTKFVSASEYCIALRKLRF
jgi:hypothetical protein